VHRPAGSPCRTRAGKTAGKCHTARFVLVPALREELEVVVPADRHPGKAWTQGPHVQPAADQEHTGRPIRVGYARCSVTTQELASQIDALQHAECRRIFSEKISTRIRIRPELQNAIQLVRDIKGAAPDQTVILTVHEIKRLARNAAELMTLAATLQGAGIQLELLMPRTVAATVSVTSRGPLNEEATAANESTFSSALSRALVGPAQAAVIAEAPASPEARGRCLRRSRRR
jgi:Resolvase, N terminal domain